MEGTYDVTLGAVTIGNVLVMKQGLYYRFECSCKLSGEVMYDLFLEADDHKMKLGLLMPSNGSFSLRTCLPIKHMGHGETIFYLKPRHAPIKEKIYPVRSDEPFQYLRALENMYLRKINGEIGLALQEKK